MRISLCMIVRDEERNLGRCLESVQGTVDEVCVLDTGSRDRTVAVAERYGARVARARWQEDFAAARNASLQLATGDWLLVLDADEVLAQTDARPRLEAFMARYPDRAGQLTIRDQGAGAERGSEVLSTVTRFLPVSRRPRFVGRVHEQVVFGPRGDTPVRAHTEVQVQHHGYQQRAMVQKGKHRRNIQLLRRELEAQPQSPYLWYQLGLTYAMADQADLAVRTLTGALHFAAADAPFIAHLSESLAYALRKLGHYDAGLGLMQELIQSHPERADTVFLHALLSMDTGDLAAAEAGFLRCLSLHGRQPAGGAYTPTAATTAPAYNLGVLYEVTGDLDKARHYYRMALSFNPRHRRSHEALVRIKRAVTA